jgi:hypothetical protein
MQNVVIKQKLTCKMDFVGGVFLSQSQNPHIPLAPLHNVYMYTVYFFTQGKGRGDLNQRKAERGATVHKAGSKIST